MNAEQIHRLKKTIQTAKPEDRAATEGLCDLALLGLWTKDKVLPLLRKLPHETEMTLPPVHPSTEPVKTTIHAQVEALFAGCPQPDILPKV